MSTTPLQPGGWLFPDVVWSRVCAETCARPESRSRLDAAAATARAVTRLTVVDKVTPAPSGDRHDFLSQAPYWWPDPSKPDGLPYLRRDGETNPEFYTTDRSALERMHTSVVTLILHAGAAPDEASARHAGFLLRQWFLNPATRMNPNLEYAQRIPGLCDGRGIGIIDTVPLCFLVDAIGHLPPGAALPAADRAGLRRWFSAYLDWLLESAHGRQECAEHNNHGTWYDAQVVACALFCGREDVARRQIEAFTGRRLNLHIAADGSQPHELARTRALSYSTFNLLGFACLAQAGRRLGIDLWGRRAASGGGIMPALRWLLPYWLGEQAWPWQQIVPFKPSQAALLLGLAAQATGDDALEQACARLSRHPWMRLCFCSIGETAEG